MAKSEIDMHMHSNRSDGFDDPEMIPWKAKQTGLKGICLTDHNCHLGLPAFMAAAARHNIDAIAGIELSTTHRGVDVHILGYGIDITNDLLLRSRLGSYWEAGQRRSEQALAQYIQAGFLPKTTTLEEIRERTGSKGPWVSMMHIRAYRVMVLNHSYQDVLGDIARGGIAYVKSDDSTMMNPLETIDFIDSLGGFPVLAHPDEFLSRTDGTPADAHRALEEVLDMFQDRRRKGLEVYHSSHSPERCSYYHELARKRGFVITAGSDSHGAFKPNVPMGMGGVTHREFLEFKRLCEA